MVVIVSLIRHRLTLTIKITQERKRESEPPLLVSIALIGPLDLNKEAQEILKNLFSYHHIDREHFYGSSKI